jgi:hypothetical protein
MSVLTRSLQKVREEVKALNDKDQALTKVRAKTKIEQRDLRLAIGRIASVLQTDAEFEAVAEYSGLTIARLKDYVFVYQQWPAGTFPADSNYTALEELARDEDRFTKITPGMSKRDARAAKGGKVDTPSRWSPKVKADFIKESLNDPEVAKEIAQDRAARAAMAEAEWQSMQARRAQQDITNPGRSAARQTTEVAELTRSLDNIRYALGKALTKAIDLGVAGRDDVLDAFQDVTLMHDGLRDYLNSGATDFDAALVAFLDEES